jgi:hypothetical protein
MEVEAAIKACLSADMLLKLSGLLDSFRQCSLSRRLKTKLCTATEVAQSKVITSKITYVLTIALATFQIGAGQRVAST